MRGTSKQSNSTSQFKDESELSQRSHQMPLHSEIEFQLSSGILGDSLSQAMLDKHCNYQSQVAIEQIQ